MPSFDKPEAIPGIISEAAKNPLGILALLIILLGILAYFFFGANLTPKNMRLFLIVRFCAFLLVFAGTCAFGWAVVRTLPLISVGNTPGPNHGSSEKKGTPERNPSPTLGGDGDPMAAYDAINLAEFEKPQSGHALKALEQYELAYGLLPQTMKAKVEKKVVKMPDVVNRKDTSQIDEALDIYARMFPEEIALELRKRGLARGNRARGKNQ
jgi:hypothetical protein